MSRILHRLGRSTAAHPWRTISAWVLVVALAAALAAAFGGTPHDDYDISGTRAQAGTDLLRDHFPAASGTTAQVVVHDNAGGRLPAPALTELQERLAAMPHVSGVQPPRLSDDGDTALLDVQYDVPVTDPDLMGNLDPLETAVAPTERAGFRVELGGQVAGEAAAPMRGYGELIGIATALLLLVLAFGSAVGAGLPVVVALTGLGVGGAGVTLLAATMDVSTAAPMVATMVGLGVGIDYALLLVTRVVEHLRAGHDVVEAAGRATATAGRSVVFASATVLVSLMGLRLAGMPVYSSFGFATAIAVVAVAAAALTLVPALCRLAGRRLLPRRVRRGRAERSGPSLTARWAARVGRRPLPWLLAATFVLLALAAPTLAMRTWPQDASSQSRELTTRQAHDLVADEFGAGANGPFTVVLDRGRLGDRGIAEVADRIADDPRIARVGPAVTSPDGEITVLTVEPAFGPTDERTSGLVVDLRDDVLPAGSELTGLTPLFQDISDMLATRVWLVIGFVVALSVLLLAMMFRSIVVPLKAAVMNLLSIAASYGVLTAAFQWGWATELLGLDHPMAVSSWVPILMFAVLFGLSMDYEVFLLSRVREEWLATGDARGSVVRGLASTGRVISAAAAIMVAVFLGFATEVDVVVKMLGFGMAVAVALDATLIRMVLVPATMALLGERNWWLPAWLDRLLPRLDAEAADDLWDELDAVGTAATDDNPADDNPADGNRNDDLPTPVGA